MHTTSLGHDGWWRFALVLASAITMIAHATELPAFELQGHRGARGLLAENSIAGFEEAVAIGVHTLELDTAITRDGVVVISHDARLNPEITRNAAGRWVDPPLRPISTFTFQELQQFDVGRIRPGSGYATRFPHQSGRDGVRIPRLADLFMATATGPVVRYNIETKVFPLEPALTVEPQAFARAVIAEIRKAGVAHRSTIQSFDWRTLATVQTEAPEIATAYLSAQQPWMDNIGAGSGAPSPWTADVQLRDVGSVPRMVKAAGGQIWSPYFGDLSPQLVREAKALGLRVIAWTVNDRPDIERMIDWRVDGIISDYPDLLRQIAAERGMPVPVPVPRAVARPPRH